MDQDTQRTESKSEAMEKRERRRRRKRKRSEDGEEGKVREGPREGEELQKAPLVVVVVCGHGSESKDTHCDTCKHGRCRKVVIASDSMSEPPSKPVAKEPKYEVSSPGRGRKRWQNLTQPVPAGSTWLPMENPKKKQKSEEERRKKKSQSSVSLFKDWTRRPQVRQEDDTLVRMPSLKLDDEEGLQTPKPVVGTGLKGSRRWSGTTPSTASGVSNSKPTAPPSIPCPRADVFTQRLSSYLVIIMVAF